MGCCNGTPEGTKQSIKSLMQASVMLAEGHRAVAALYLSLVDAATTPEDKAAMVAAAETHKQFAKATIEVTVPDNLVTEAEEAVTG